MSNINEKDIVDQFVCGFDCGQVVVSYFSEYLNIEEDHALKIASGFGGGMFCGKTCGAISGGIIVLGLRYGHHKSNDFLSKENNQKIIQEFITTFTEMYKYTDCKDLLKYDISKKNDLDKIIEKNLLFTFCPKLVNFVIITIEHIFNKYN